MRRSGTAALSARKGAEALGSRCFGREEAEEGALRRGSEEHIFWNEMITGSLSNPEIDGTTLRHEHAVTGPDDDSHISTHVRDSYGVAKHASSLLR